MSESVPLARKSFFEYEYDNQGRQFLPEIVSPRNVDNPSYGS